MTILDNIRDYVTRYVAFADPAQADVISLFILHTHAFDTARTTPYLYITSAEKQSGKTRTLEVLETICKTATRADNLTSSVMFRLIESRQPTLMVDEVDTIFSGAKNEELRGVLNSGYKRGGFIFRAMGNPNDEDGGVVQFNTFCPKILAGIDNGYVPDTVQDRSIRIVLRRKAAGQTVEEFYAEDVEELAEDLIQDINAWVEAHRPYLTDRDRRPERITTISDRANEISRPLLTLASHCDGWDSRARAALAHLLGEDEAKLSDQARALLSVREWFSAHPEADRIKSETIRELTKASGKQIGVWFNAYGIKPKTLTFDGTYLKGYQRAAFTDAFERYLPADTDNTDTTGNDGE